ncbi:nuclear pore complex protein Nup188 [Colletes latitarsis]|uniref:nuclear pore complex protein Nup188 n=1 Tax=Colletes latitarsis TaxID=2605962 RepID=UPI0040373A91
MEAPAVESLPYCKELWFLISDTVCRCERQLVEDEIKKETKLLKEGLLYFKPYTEASLQNIPKNDPSPRMYELISKLAPLLNLDATITWDLVCNFIKYEYRNCTETFASQLVDYTSMKVLINDIWNFYYSERMTLIKCLKLMVEYKDNEHRYQKEFAKFFDSVLFGTLLESIQKQIETLKTVNPPIRSQLCTEEYLHRLYNSSLVEMRELLHILTVIIHDIHIADTEFLKLYESIGGEPRRLASTKSHEDKKAIAKKIKEIQYSQAALFLVALDVRKHVDMEDWIRSVRNSMQETFEHKCIRDSYPQDSPLFLSWMLANYAIDPENMDTLNRFKPFGIKAIQLNVFHYLQDLMNTEMICEKTHYAEVVHSSVYNLLTLVCAFVDEEKLSVLNGIFDAVAATIQFPKTAARFWEERDDGLWLIYKFAAEQFPYEFEPLTNIAIGLATASETSAEKIAAELDNLQSLTLEVPRQRDHNKPFKPYEQECMIHKNSYAIAEDSLRENIRMSSDREVVIFRQKACYWDALHYKIEQLFSQAGGGITNISEMTKNLPEIVSQGLKLLKTLAKYIGIPQSMVIPTELSFEIINRFSYPVLPEDKMYIYKIVAACISISSELVLEYPEEILSRMRAGVYPRFNNRYQKTLDFAEAVSFDGGIIASWLSSIETIAHSYPILNAYLDILSKYLIRKYNEEALYTVEIPGMVFLLQGVLPKLDSWYFDSDAERTDLWLKSMFCLHRALESSLPKEDMRNELQLVVAYSLLYLEPRHALLKLIRTGERTLHNKMMAETDWIRGKGFKAIKSVQLALSVVNRLLIFRKSLGLETGDRSPLEAALYSSPRVPNGLLIVPTIVNYLYVWFSPPLQAMAVRLLKKFAEGSSMSLLVCMGMDGTAIRETFASRRGLMSPTCVADVKVAILELVAVCLEKQPGLTEALFNIVHPAECKRIFPRSVEEFFTEGCRQFLVKYLNRIYEKEDIVCDKLYNSTMALLRAMWYHRNEILVNFFRKREKFWTHLFAPLFRDLVPGAKGYSHLLDIITLELFKSSVLEDDFSMNLRKFLDKSKDYWKKLAIYILEDVHSESDRSMNYEKQDTSILHSQYESNLESWYNFIVTLTDERIATNYPVNVIQAQLITQHSLGSLLERVKQSHDLGSRKITMLLASLSLRCITSWKQICVDDSRIFKSGLTQLMQEIGQAYRSYGKSLRQTLMSLLLGCVQCVKKTLREDATSLEYLLAHSCTIAASELEQLREAAVQFEKRKQQQPIERTVDEKGTIGSVTAQKNADERNAETLRGIRESLPATLAVCMVTQLLRSYVERSSLSKQQNKAGCVQLRQMIPELMACIGITLQKYPYLRFSTAALNLLNLIVRSPYTLHPINENDIAKLWLSLIPPADIGNSMLDSLYDDCTNGKWRCQDWWPLYTLGLEFLTGLVTRETPTVYIKSIVMFLDSHEHQLMVASTLLRHTADLLAADLLQSLVALINIMATLPYVWNSIQKSVCETLIKCMYLAYDNTVNLLLRPRILKFIIDGISMESAEELESCDKRSPSDELKLLVNKLIIINTTCALSFVYFSPRLNTLVDTIYTQDFWYTPMAEMNFGPPQMSIISGPRLTYGTIISSTQLFTQALHSRSQPVSSSSVSFVGQNDKTDSAKREWEHATPEDRRMHTSKDLRRMIHAASGSASRSSNVAGDFLAYVSGLDVTVPLLSSPRLVRRPYDPLICENTILSRATALTSGRHVTKGGGSITGKSGSSPVVTKYQKFSDPWFESMDENNTRLALEINLVLILCQALEGVRSPRIALRDRQLIARETVTELGVFFDFLEHRGTPDNWLVKGSLISADTKSVRTIDQSVDPSYNILPARLKESFREELEEDIFTTGRFTTNVSSVQFLPLMGKLLKAVVESLDLMQYR